MTPRPGSRAVCNRNMMSSAVQASHFLACGKAIIEVCCSENPDSAHRAEMCLVQQWGPLRVSGADTVGLRSS